MKALQALRRLLDRLDADDDPAEPAYDPVQLGGTLIVSMIAAGALFWLLWSLLVFEGGIFVKLRALLELAFGGKSLAELGWRGPHEPGVFEGWLGNACAFALLVGTIFAIDRLFAAARRK